MDINPIHALVEKLIWENPDRLFEIIEKSGGSLEELKKIRMGRLLVTERYPELASNDVEQAVDFVFWLSYFMERGIRDDILNIEIALGKPPKDTEAMLDEMNFGAKIKFLEDNYVDKGKKDEYIETLVEIKRLRNDLSHGELDKLTYGGYHLSDPRGQIKLTVKLRSSALRKK